MADYYEIEFPGRFASLGETLILHEHPATDSTAIPPPEPGFRDQRKIDADHLRILSICHYVGAGLSLLGLGFIGLHYAIMGTVFANPAMWENAKDGPPPEAFFTFFSVFKWFYLAGAVMLVAYGIMNFLSARFIKARRHRTFSLVLGGVNCLRMPLGTLLGVFTIIVLTRESVREIYGET